MRPFPLDLGDAVELRRLSPDDAADVFAVVDANRDRLDPWMPWTEGTRSVEDQRVWLESVTTDPDGLEGVGIFVEGRYAGNAGISRHDAFGIAAEIGYWIDGAYEGRGIVTKAVRTMVDICFRDLEVHRVVIRAALENARSRAIPERLGFTLEGVLRGEGKGSGPYGFHDLAVYGLLEEEWTTM